MMAASNVNSNHSTAHLSKSNATFAPTKTSEQTNAMDIEQLQHMINCTVKVCFFLLVYKLFKLSLNFRFLWLFVPTEKP